MKIKIQLENDYVLTYVVSEKLAKAIKELLDANEKETRFAYAKGFAEAKREVTLCT